MSSIPGPWHRTAEYAGLLDEHGNLATTIFTEMSSLAVRHGAINLGQGFPDEDGPKPVLDVARDAIAHGVNQYPPGAGAPELRQAISDHQRRFYGLEWDPNTEVLVTTGATEAIAATLLALVEPGDEVITLQPYYDAYAAIIGLTGARHVTVDLVAPDFALDLDQLEAAFGPRTRAILLNTPNNPTGAVLSDAALARVVELAEKWDVTIVTDEVYEHLVFDVPYRPLATLPGARERTVSISSAGKTFSVTGWKIGWITAPAAYVQAILTVKQYLTFTTGAPFQPAVAEGLRMEDAFFAGIAGTLADKYRLLAGGLERAGFAPLPSHGTYFMIADAAPLGFSDAAQLCRELPERVGVVGIPVTAFVHPRDRHRYASLVRFAFCKRHDVIAEASERLAGLGA